MPRRNRDGYVFYEDQHYLRKVGTSEFFAYSPELAAREDMHLYDPWAHKTQGQIARGPGVDEVVYHKNRTKDLTGLDREEIREIIKNLNRTQRLIWSIDILFRRSAFKDLEQFFIIRNDIIRIMGPSFTVEEAQNALEIYKTNPGNVEALIAAAATPSVEEQNNDLASTANTGCEPAG